MIKINKQENNTYNFSLNTTTGNALLYSVGFSSKEEIKNVVSGLKLLDKQHYKFERKTDHNGNFLFNLKDKKGQLIGNSQLYGSEAGMENGIKNLKKRIAILKVSESL
ncbi:YegP family protein [uncultured Eudoraea sp.]|uniref:YegP family protein n=1 Tax=uncultured Eudoraea sp. TaxID=1035614 RepID=UPI00262ADCED|nr:YegP family protein [uncultured Eudoraea sp.]